MMKYLQGSIGIYSVQIYTMLHTNTSTPTKEQEQRGVIDDTADGFSEIYIENIIEALKMKCINQNQ